MYLLFICEHYRKHILKTFHRQNNFLVHFSKLEKLRVKTMHFDPDFDVRAIKITEESWNIFLYTLYDWWVKYKKLIEEKHNIFSVFSNVYSLQNFLL